MLKRARCLLFFFIFLSVAASAGGQTSGGPPATLQVPLIYEEPSGGTAVLSLDYGAPFDPRKRTVLVIADGQQFYVRSGVMKELKQSTFGDTVNVVGIVTRGTTPAFINATLGANGKPDWIKAWKVFNSSQWIHDVEAARIALVGKQGRIDLYGRSGGAYLVHQYLSKYPEHVDRVFTQSAVIPSLNAELGIPACQAKGRPSVCQLP
jgi:hypothetical protein